MTESERAVFEKVRDLIAACMGVDRTRISTDSDLCRDLGVAGADGCDLFTAFDNAFDVDWTGLYLGVHFGNESCFPSPRQLKNNCVMYETQPCKVSDVVQAVMSGRWRGTPLVLRSESARAMLYVLSTVQIVFVCSMGVAIFAGILFGLIR